MSFRLNITEKDNEVLKYMNLKDFKKNNFFLFYN